MTDIARFLIIAGITLAVVGVLLLLAAKLGLGPLPGDLILRGRGFTFYFPIVTSILLSALFSLVLWLIFRSRGQ